MEKKLLFIVSFVMCFQIMQSQSLSNLVFQPIISPSTGTVDLTFDYAGVVSGDTFEWQLTLANADGSPNFSRNIAYQTAIVPTSTGSGTQTVTLGIYNSPVDGEVFTWAGKITLGSDGSDTGYNNTGNLVTISSTASVDEFTQKNFKAYPNPVIDNLYIKTDSGIAHNVEVYDVSGRMVLKNDSLHNEQSINVENLNSGFYVLVIDKIQVLKFLKQ